MALPGVPRIPKDVTEAWLERVLRQRHGDDYRLKGTELVTLNLGNHVAACSHMTSIRCRGQVIPSSGGYDWTTQEMPFGCDPFHLSNSHNNIDRNGGHDGEAGDDDLIDHLLVKLMPVESSIREVVTLLRMPQCEAMVYSEMLPSMFEFERSRGCEAVRTMVPDCVYAKFNNDHDRPEDSLWKSWEALEDGLMHPVECGMGSIKSRVTMNDLASEDDAKKANDVSKKPAFAIVLDNLQPAGFWTPNQLQLPEEPLFAAVRQLARLGATSNAWLRHHNVREIPYLMETPLPDDHVVKDFIRTGVSKLEPGLKQRENIALLHKLMRMQEKSVGLISDHLKPPNPDLRVIAHGDFRGGNLLLRESSDGDWDVKVIDWQVSMLSHPAVDLVYLLIMSIPRDVMKRVESSVLLLYCDAFREAAESLNVPCMLENQTLAEDFRRCKLLGLMWCLSCMTFWDRVKVWPEHCIDIAQEVDALGLLDDI